MMIDNSGEWKFINRQQIIIKTNARRCIFHKTETLSDNLVVAMAIAELCQFFKNLDHGVQFLKFPELSDI